MEAVPAARGSFPRDRTETRLRGEAEAAGLSPGPSCRVGLRRAWRSLPPELRPAGSRENTCRK